MNPQLFDDAVADALCPFFEALVPATSTIAAFAPLFGPKGIVVSRVAIPVTYLSMLGAAATCSQVEAGSEPYEPRGCCQEVSSRGQLLYFNSETGTGGPGDLEPVKKIISTYEGPPVGPGQPTTSVCEYQRTSGEIRTAAAILPHASTVWCLEPYEGSVCINGTEPEPGPINPPVPPHIYIDKSTNCTYIVNFQGFIQPTPGGAVSPVFQIESQNQTRAGGGLMGGCNLDPVIYTPGPTGPGGPNGPTIPPIPVPFNPPDPIDGVPWWASALLAGSTAAALTLIGQALNEALAPRLPEGSFTLEAPCDVDEEGNPLYQVWEYPEQKVEERMLAHQITILEALQTHLNWKTPICTNEKPQLEGTWISTRWISDGNSPGGERPLRKLFRYRSKSTLTDEQLRDYWADFSWQAGPTCVSHGGAWWGTPQVWASSPEEGQRVLRFAAAEAGIDPDQVGEWFFSSSRSPRYGMPGTMRLESPNGTRWVTRRDGPSSVPA